MKWVFARLSCTNRKIEPWISWDLPTVVTKPKRNLILRSGRELWKQERGKCGWRQRPTFSTPGVVHVFSLVLVELNDTHRGETLPSGHPIPEGSR